MNNNNSNNNNNNNNNTTKAKEKDSEDNNNNEDGANQPRCFVFEDGCVGDKTPCVKDVMCDSLDTMDDSVHIDGTVGIEDGRDVSSQSGHDFYSYHQGTVSTRGLGWTTKYKQGLKHTVPVRCERPQKDMLPLDTLGVFNYMTFGWLTRLLWMVYRRGAGAVSHLTITPTESAEINAVRMEKFWKAEMDRKGVDKASVASVIFRSFRTRFLIGSVFNLIGTVLTMANPIFVINYFLEYLSGEEVTLGSGIHYVILLSVFLVLRGLCGSFCWMLHTVAATRIKNGTQALIYRKILNIKSLGDKCVGDLVNLFSLDGQCLWDGVTNCPLLVGGAVGLIISCVYSLHFMGPWALMAWLVIVGFPILAGSLAKRSMMYREKSIQVTDQRVGLLSEILTYMNFIKINAWEKPLGQNITDLRIKERKILEMSVFTMSSSMGSAMLVPLFAACFTFIGYVATGNDLTAQQAFTFLSLLNTMQISLATIPFALKSLSDMFVSSRRIKELLMMTEMNLSKSSMSSPSIVIEMNNAQMSWVNRTKSQKDPVEDQKVKSQKKRKNNNNQDKDDEEKLTQNEETTIYTGPVLKDITFILQRGHLLGVCGQVGCGKSTLLNAILGRMHTVSGSIAVSACIAYVSQQAWITNDTIRDNIVFGSDFDEDRYKQVLQVCALQEDLESLPKGDLTEVGERGATLSGGQKQRVSLARAAYSKADLILLDDPLSAVDVYVGKHIFEQCIRGFLKGKSIVFVTHQLQYLRHCDQILIMQNGCLVESGSHQELLSIGGSYVSFLKVYQQDSQDLHKNERENGGTEDGDRNTDKDKEHIHYKELSSKDKHDQREKHNPNTEMSTWIKKEEMENSVHLSVLVTYIKAMGGYLVMAMVLFCFAIPVAGITGANWFLSYWINEGPGDANITNTTTLSLGMTDNPNKDLYLIIYACFIPVILTTMVLRSWVTSKACLSASSTIHNYSLKWLLRQPLAFFLSTPVGRIINRFSTDLDEIDNRLPMHMEIFLMNVFQVVAALTIIVYVSPWFLIGIIPIAIIFCPVVTLFHTCFHKLKCLDNVTRSPILSHLSATVQGLSSIHAYCKTKQFFIKYCKLLDSNSVAVFLYYSTNRWLALRLDIISALVIFLTGLLILVNFKFLNPALAGLGLAYVMQISGLFQFTVRLAMETEARCSSLQRLQEYCDNSSRDRDDSNKGDASPSLILPSIDWPKHGQVTFSKVSLCYHQGLTPALKSVTFEVKAGEKIGIVGRTGAGKSSLCSVLFRMYDLDTGEITIDGVDIRKVDITVLRSKLSVVPQDPVLLAGTIRYNLDPFQQHTDASLWQALERCHAADVVKSLEHQLDTTVHESGSNFSIGEKQLLCMARVFLKRSQILFLDEATASVDTETHALIQQTLKEAFASCTMLVIAHRLDTVLSFDKILVMKDGEVIEFNTPSKLLSDTSSKFSAMLNATEITGEKL